VKLVGNSVRPCCEICGNPGTPWLEKRGRRLLRCTVCGFAWVPDGVLHTPRALSIYEDREFNLYARETDYYRDESAEDAARAKVAWVARFVGAGGRLLDVGANVGTFVYCARERFEAVGIEPNSGAVAWGREHVGGHVEIGSISHEVAAYVGQFDAVTMFDVIEHLDTPAAALRQCRRYLTTGGTLFITTPDIGSLSARLLGRAWYYIDLEQHVSMFSTMTLSRLLESEGFEVIARRTFGRRYRFSYIERRLKDLSHQSALLRVLHGLTLPLRLAPRGSVRINVGDVVGIAAVRR
jgi:2-polyprenyl-3-methyl-5-hydroxy-6-metoxy-1,4-benzoquinol methylase